METSKPQTIGETVEIVNTMSDGFVHTNGENKKKKLVKKSTQQLQSDDGYTKDD